MNNKREKYFFILLVNLTIFELAILPTISKYFFMEKSVFYHAGCPVCLSAEQEIVPLIGNENVEVVHLGEQRNRIAEAEAKGVKSVPALLTPTGNILHLNYGASLADVKG